jgi:hypothetical protein
VLAHPSRLASDDAGSVLNIYPTRALALATAALAIVHGAFALRGRVVMVVAGLWAAGLAFTYAALAVRSAGVLGQPSGLSATAGGTAGLTVNLWINSAMLVLGAMIRVASSRLRSPPHASL